MVETFFVETKTTSLLSIIIGLFQIERWWRELHHRLEKYFKTQLQMLFDEGYYNPDEQLDR